MAVVSRPPAVRRKPKASDEAPTYKSVLVTLSLGYPFSKIIRAVKRL